VFFVIKLVVSGGVPLRWDDHAYASMFWMIDRLHTAHVLAAILMGIVAVVLAFRGYFTRERRLGMEVVNIYFQFVALVWLPVLVVLFLVPRWT
jgi:cytochrome c oxidase subunit III